jgi:ribosome maturation factor RimP
LRERIQFRSSLESVKWAVLPAHFFWLIDFLPPIAPNDSTNSTMLQHSTIETTVAALGYELVDVERAAGGLLRVTIDHPLGTAGAPECAVTVDDCERVTRQLQHVLEVEAVAYERLEVSSPGLDRPLKTAGDFARFAGAEVELTLKKPFQGRKRYRGTLQAHGEEWRIVLADRSAARQGARRRSGKGGAKATPPVEAAPGAAGQVLDFSLDEVREAHLVPMIDFKGRSGARPGAVAAPHGNQETDGGRTQ